MLLCVSFLYQIKVKTPYTEKKNNKIQIKVYSTISILNLNKNLFIEKIRMCVFHFRNIENTSN